MAPQSEQANKPYATVVDLVFAGDPRIEGTNVEQIANELKERTYRSQP